MEFKICIIVSYLAALADTRGPHHPRGGKVVKRHVHYKPTRDTSEKLTQNEELLHDEEHIKEHLEDVIPEPDFSTMTDDEIEFYYFQVHDSDKNSKLDGLEILHALSHTGQHASDENENAVPTEGGLDDLELYVELIDQVLEEDDVDEDGYLSYSEYVTGRRRSKKKIVENSIPEVQNGP